MSNNKKSSVDKEFVPYEEALALKELGFDEPCLSVYDKDSVLQRSLLEYPIINSKNNFHEHWNIITAPLYQQAFRWFREKHNLPSHIHTIWQHDWNNYSYQWHITEDKNEWTGIRHFETYEEAEFECLRKLIEIVKEVKNEQ
jgi:hypothetical protein